MLISAYLSPKKSPTALNLGLPLGSGVAEASVVFQTTPGKVGILNPSVLVAGFNTSFMFQPKKLRWFDSYLFKRAQTTNQ